jgi:diguanylate cyclase (GGDEF)-like protein
MKENQINTSHNNTENFFILSQNLAPTHEKLRSTVSLPPSTAEAACGRKGAQAVMTLQGLASTEGMSELLDIITNKRIRSVFQPIFNLHSGEVYAYEALSRIIGPSSFSNPEILFSAAAQHNLTEELETLAIRTALDTASAIGLDRLITLNICPSLLVLGDRKPENEPFIIKELAKVKSKVILELTERFFIPNDNFFSDNLHFYQGQGLRIAIDDLGCGFAGLKMLAQIEPAMVKVDRFLISGIDRSTQKRMLLESIVSFCHKMNSLVVAEGIETEADLRVVMDLKVDLGQGYLFAMPDQRPQKCPQNIKELISSYRSAGFGKAYPVNHVGSLVQSVEPIQSSALVETLVERFQADENLAVVPVLDGIRPVGIVHKHKLFYRLGQRFGFALHTNKPISNIMESAVLLDAGTALDDVSRIVLNRDESNIYDALLVTQTGTYIGIVKVSSILEAISAQKLSMALQANPLTGLPGNNLIKEEVESRLSGNRIFAVCYFDLDNFKPFNDFFGFAQGDRVIRFVGDFLTSRLKQWDPLAFMGHVGGDDFVAVCKATGIENFCQSVLDSFQREIQSFHDPESIERGYYTSTDRHGNPCRFNLLSLSIAVVSNRNRVFSSFAHIASVASEVKKKAKKIAGNSYYIDGRTS